MILIVKIKIKGAGKRAILITFQIDSNKFESLSERSKFFEKLYGRNQKIKRESRNYEYHRLGLLNTMKHIKVDNSVFIVAMEHMRRMEQFFKEWEDKVMVKSFLVLVTKKDAKELEREVEIE